MTEEIYSQPVVVSTTVTPVTPTINRTEGKIANRKKIVYKTLIDPAVLRIDGERNKCSLFNESIFRHYRPEEVDFVSIEKYYEPFISVNGKYSLDYYRKSVYCLRVSRQVKEVVLFNRTFNPEQDSRGGERRIQIEGEERLLKDTRAFLFLNRYGQDANIKEFPSGPSENNPEELIESLNMAPIPANMDVELMRHRIAERPYDVNRVVSEVFEVDERSLVYAPRFKLKYKCRTTGKEAFLEYDGVTAKPFKQKQNIIVATMKRVTAKLKEVML